MASPVVSPSPSPAGPASPQPPADLAALSPENIAGLRQVGELRYSPWDLVLSLAWSAQGEWLAVAAGEQIHLYDGRTFQQGPVLQAGVWAASLVFLLEEQGGGPFLAFAGKDGSVQLWDAGLGRRICRIQAHAKGANSVARSPDGRSLASTGNDGIVRVWDLAEAAGGGACPEEPAAEMIGGAFAVTDVAFSPDGAALAAASARIVHLREPGSGRLIRTLFGEASIFSLAWSPDGQRLASAETGGIARLWDVATGQVAATLERPAGLPAPANLFLWCVAFSPDGRLLAGGASDGLLLLWDPAATPAHSLALPGQARAIASLAFRPDGRLLATGSLDGTVFLWGAP